MTTLTAYPVSLTEGWVIEPASPKRDWMDEIPNQFAYRCLPLVMANQFGWVVRSPTDVEAVWNGDTHHDGSMEVRVADEDYEAFFLSHFGFGILTISLPWLFKTSEECGLLVRGPTNAHVPNAAALDGFVETNWSPATFTMNWRVLEPKVPVRFKKGDVVCQIQPYPIRTLESCTTRIGDMSEDPAFQAHYDEWVDRRRTFNDKRGRKAEEWQKDYMVGRLPDGVPVKEHRTTLKLDVFE